MRPVVLVASTLLALASAGAQQQPEPRWQTIASSTDAVVSFDRQTVNRLRDGSYAAWVEFRHRQPQSADSSGATFDRTMYREQVDCVERRDRWLSMTQFLGAQRVKSLNSDRGDAPWTYPTPGSVGEKIVSAVCERARRGAT